MKVGIIGDVHGNVDALLSVLEALEKAGVDQVLCTGDVVGYGACPRECIDIIRELEIPCAKGNHDDYTTQVGADWHIQPHAKEVIRWNQDVLADEYLVWLLDLPRIVHFEGIEVVHSSHVWWPEYPYVINETAAVQSFLFQSCRISFNGHTHVPIYVSHQPGQRPQLDLLRNMFLPRTQRMLISVGSVGQPRDGDARACSVIYDVGAQAVRILRVPYDVESAQSRIVRAGLPEELAARLAAGR